MNCYIDSSALLRALFHGTEDLKGLEDYAKAGSSELILIECSRVLERYRLENLVSDDQLAEAREALRIVTDGLFLIELSAGVKRRAAESFPTVIGALDAIHLASALLWRQGEPEEILVLFSYDRQMLTCARALGLPLYPRRDSGGV